MVTLSTHQVNLTAKVTRNLIKVELKCQTDHMAVHFLLTREEAGKLVELVDELRAKLK